MAATNDFKPFATGVGANVMSQADYLAAVFLANGFAAGIAPSAQLNKVWRQSAFMTAVLAQFVANVTGVDVLDDGDEANKVTLLTDAISLSAAIRPAVIEPLSTARNILVTEYAIGFARVAAPGATPANLPAGAAVGQQFLIQDLTGNAFAFNINVNAPAGMTIAGLGTFTMNINRQSCIFTFYGSNLWGVQ